MKSLLHLHVLKACFVYMSYLGLNIYQIEIFGLKCDCNTKYSSSITSCCHIIIIIIIIFISEMFCCSKIIYQSKLFYQNVFHTILLYCTVYRVLLLTRRTFTRRTTTGQRV